MSELERMNHRYNLYSLRMGLEPLKNSVLGMGLDSISIYPHLLPKLHKMSKGLISLNLKLPYRIHGTGICTYAKTITINQSCSR